MKKENHFDLASSSLKDLKEHLLLYIPDLLFYLTAALLSFSFLHLNGLTSIFSGQLDLFKEQIKTIVGYSPSFLKLILSLIFSLILSIFVRLGTDTLRFTMIKNIVQHKKFTFFEVYKESNTYLLRVFLLKFCFFFIYSLPFAFLFFIGLFYKPALVFTSFFVFALTLVLRFLFLFSYPLSFLKDIKNPFKTIEESLLYFKEHKEHTLITGIFVIFISSFFGLLLNLLPLLFAKLGFLRSFSVLTFLFFLLKTLVEITVDLWTQLFTFKNY